MVNKKQRMVHDTLCCHVSPSWIALKAAKYRQPTNLPVDKNRFWRLLWQFLVRPSLPRTHDYGVLLQAAVKLHRIGCFPAKSWTFSAWILCVCAKNVLFLNGWSHVVFKFSQCFWVFRSDEKNHLIGNSLRVVGAGWQGWSSAFFGRGVLLSVFLKI